MNEKINLPLGVPADLKSAVKKCPNHRLADLQSAQYHKE